MPKPKPKIKSIYCKYCNEQIQSFIDPHHICPKAPESKLWKNNPGRYGASKPQKQNPNRSGLPNWLDEENKKAIKKDTELKLNRLRNKIK